MTTQTIPEWLLTDRLRKAREHAGIEQAAMAAWLGVSRNTVGNYENGRTRPRLIVLRAWAQATSVDLAWLTGEATRDEAPATVGGGTPERRANQRKRTPTWTGDRRHEEDKAA